MEGNRGMLLEDHNDSLLVKKKEREKERKKRKKTEKKPLPCLLSLRQGESVWPCGIHFFWKNFILHYKNIFNFCIFAVCFL